MLSWRHRTTILRFALGLGLAALAQGCDNQETSTTGNTGGGGSGAAGGGGSGGGTGGTGGSGGAGGGDLCPPGSHDENGICTSTLTGWAAGPGLVQRRDHHIAFVVEAEQGAFLYSAAGTTDLQTLHKSVERAAIQGDGSLGEWQSAGDMPIRAGGRTVAVLGKHVVAAGGHTGTSLSRRSDVGTVAADGAITWAQGPDMGLTRFHGASVAVGDTVYVVGGLTGDNTNNTPSVEMAKLGADGVLAAWTETTALPEKRSHHALAASDKRLYVTGGLQGDPAGLYKSLDDILLAEILPDGTLGPWGPAGTLPVFLATHSSFMHMGHLYVVGGIDKVAAIDGVYRAPILEDGTVGPWETMPALPRKRAHGHQSPVWNGFVYAPGGAIDHKSYSDVFIGKLE